MVRELTLAHFETLYCCAPITIILGGLQACPWRLTLAVNLLTVLQNYYKARVCCLLI
jgi:hypothetical protein